MMMTWMRIGAKLKIAILAAGLFFSAQVFAKSAEPCKIMVLGDSLSAEYGLTRGTGWVNLLEKNLHSTFSKQDCSLVNASISGETTAGGVARIEALLQQHAPTWVLVELGGNDGLRGLALAHTEENLNKIIRASAKNGTYAVLIGMQIPPNYGRAYAQQFKEMYPKLAKQHKVPLVPFFLEGIGDKPEWFQADRIHPNQAAQQILFDNVWKVFQPVLKKHQK